MHHSKGFIIRLDMIKLDELNDVIFLIKISLKNCWLLIFSS